MPMQDQFAVPREVRARGGCHFNEQELAQNIGALPPEEGLDLQQAPCFDAALVPATEAFQTFITESLLPDVLATEPCRRMHYEAAGAALTALVANLAYSAFGFRPTLYTRLSRSHGRITTIPRYNRTGAGSRVFAQLVDGMVALGWMEQRIGTTIGFAMRGTKHG
jgi:hypothetical protein